MNNVEPLPLQVGESYVVPLAPEDQQSETVLGAIFPALVPDVGQQDEIRPRFRREVVKQISEWLAAWSGPGACDLGACFFEGDVLVHFRPDQAKNPLEILADHDGLYQLGQSMPFGVLPMSSPAADAELLADHDRLVRQTGEVMVSLFLDYDDPAFPALVGDDRWNGWVCPRFRREVAEVVAAWTNEIRRRYPEGGELAYWDGATLVLLEAHCNGGGVAERVEPDEDGLYRIGGWRWTWDLLPDRPDTSADQDEENSNA